MDQMGNSGLVASVYRIISARLYVYIFFINRSTGSGAAESIMKPAQSKQLLQEKIEECKNLEQEVQKLQEKLEASKSKQSKVQSDKKELHVTEQGLKQTIQELQTQYDRKTEDLERKNAELQYVQRWVDCCKREYVVEGMGSMRVRLIWYLKDLCQLQG